MDEVWTREPRHSHYINTNNAKWKSHLCVWVPRALKTLKMSSQKKLKASKRFLCGSFTLFVFQRTQRSWNERNPLYSTLFIHTTTQFTIDQHCTVFLHKHQAFRVTSVFPLEPFLGTLRIKLFLLFFFLTQWYPFMCLLDWSLNKFRSLNVTDSKTRRRPSKRWSWHQK